MGHPVVKHRVSQARGAQPPPVSPLPPSARSREPRLLPMLLPIFILGGLAILHVISLARLSELEAESRRLERLSLQQTMRRGELMRERSKLVDTGKLAEYGRRQGLVNPLSVHPVKVGVLPPGKVYWALPGEGKTGTFPAVGQIGQLLPPQPSGSQSL